MTTSPVHGLQALDSSAASPIATIPQPVTATSPLAPGAAIAATPTVTVVTERCAGCQECVVRCPTGALTMDIATWTVSADSSACVGCRQCVRTCPFTAIDVSGPLLVAERTPLPGSHMPEPLIGSAAETRLGFGSWDAALAEASRCLQCPDPTCVRGCPVHNDIPGFVAAIRERDLEEAHAVLRRTTLLPDVCSRVCDQAVQCEGACTWSLAGGTPVAIGALERFVTEHHPVPPLRPTSRDGNGLSVAVVGSGPAGIGAAWELAAAGADVTVLERDAEPGGLLGWGIPDFTLPAAVADRPWHQLVEAGVRLRCGVEVTPGDVDQLLEKHDAVVLAMGAGAAIRLPVEGGTLGSVIDATEFLTSAEIALREHTPLPALEAVRPSDGRAPRVLVVGGGNTAMDVARSARRFAAEAICVEWMSERFAPVRPDELAEARDEGVDVRFATTLVRLEGSDGRVQQARLQRTRQASARKRPTLIDGSEETVEVDLVVMAMGYRKYPDFSVSLTSRTVARVAEGLPSRSWQASGILAVDQPAFARHQPVGKLALGRETARTAAAIPARDRVWVAGDALVGPSTVVEAMAQGRRAAKALLSRLAKTPGRITKPRSVLMAVESRGGHTREKAEKIASQLRRAGHVVAVAPLAEVGLAQIAAADLLIVGTWVEGLVVAGVRPARATRRFVKELPELGETPVAAFCTYGVNPRGALSELGSSLTQRGGHLVASAAFGPRGGDKVTSFVSSLVSTLREGAIPVAVRN